MEDEVSTRPRTTSADKMACNVDGDGENLVPIPGNSKKLILNLSAGGEEGRKPFRKVSSSSSSGNKKKPLQKQKSSSSMRRIKCVLIGDSKTGKSALVRSLLQGQSISDYVPTTQDEHVYNMSSSSPSSPSLKKKVDQENGRDEQREKDKIISLQICDTGGQVRS